MRKRAHELTYEVRGVLDLGRLILLTIFNKLIQVGAAMLAQRIRAGGCAYCVEPNR